MSQPLLSILIPTVVGREYQLEKLLEELYRQRMALRFPNYVSIQFEKDNKEMTIGEKRELLYLKSPGYYSWQIDDDDTIAPNAIALILNEIHLHNLIPCITFRENCMINGQYYSSNHSLKYERWQDNFDGFNYVRSPFYKNVIRTDIARSVPFPRIRWNEDEQWSMALRPKLSNEIHIDQELYFYIHNSKPEEHNERYGIK